MRLIVFIGIIAFGLESQASLPPRLHDADVREVLADLNGWFPTYDGKRVIKYLAKQVVPSEEYKAILEQDIRKALGNRDTKRYVLFLSGRIYYLLKTLMLRADDDKDIRDYLLSKYTAVQDNCGFLSML